MAAAQQGVETTMACDVLVVGGGINGAGIARDAAGRGLSVVLCEKDDLASHTSSASTKLIHGGLRYLEYYEFGLVRKALIEREVLLRSAPHIMWPLRFVMPHAQGQRPAWLIRAGLFLYDMLAKREILPGSQGIDLTRHAAGKPLKPEFKRGFVYSDGWVDDARLVVLNAIDAADKGATILTQTRCTALRRDGAGADASWLATLLQGDGRELSVRARSVVNAAGPWTAEFLQQAAPGGQGRHLRLIKGSHIVVKRLFEHDHAYIFQHPDGRIVFAIPYEHDFTLIGTTDLDYHGDSGKVEIDDEEIRYLCELSSYYFSKPIVPADVVWTYAGVRPLVEDAAADAKAVTRDYRFELDREGAPLLSIFGGKITTFRKLAEEALDVLAPLLAPVPGSARPAWTANACLPGGDVFGSTPQNRSVREFGQFVQGLQRDYAWLPAALVARYARAYGTRIHVLLAGRTDVAAMGEEVAAGLYAAEVDYLRRHEWAVSAADMLWRRSKLGLHLPRETADTLDAWLLQHPLSS
ncbi:glycerol-3-phosphate dehydrogenase [Janthinobacterium agaricidamnosum]|uniref:Glycerol-3-phosphate dehydrogenase n=2 Tax=Janthinobacterium agaricidamnosum TaxID=55508 RepID=A0A3G2EBQ1_9BURK|nr:glycerol-3-phosphate dehydrogenase [Janthinobacterium agaricidamnosum]